MVTYMLTMVFWDSSCQQFIEDVIVSLSGSTIGDTRLLKQVWNLKKMSKNPVCFAGKSYLCFTLDFCTSYSPCRMFYYLQTKFPILWMIISAFSNSIITSALDAV